MMAKTDRTLDQWFRASFTNRNVRLLWFGVIIVALMNFFVVLSGNVAYQQIAYIPSLARDTVGKVSNSKLVELSSFERVIRSAEALMEIDETSKSINDVYNDMAKHGHHHGNNADSDTEAIHELLGKVKETNDARVRSLQHGTGEKKSGADTSEHGLVEADSETKHATNGLPFKQAINVTQSKTLGNTTHAPLRKKGPVFVEDTNFESHDVSSSDIADYNNATKKLQRPAKCEGCFRSEFKFHSGTHICRTMLDDKPEPVDIIILITSSYKHMRQRKTLRSTWLTRTKQNTAKVRYAFIFGQTSNSRLARYVVKESQMYRDIVIADFEDTYHNLTYKTIAAFKWVQQYCGQVKTVLKTDDDMYINVENLIKLSTRFKGLLRSHVIGSCKKQAPVRIASDKQYVSRATYPGDLYPAVCSGTGYVTGIEVVTKILNISPNIPYLHLEDVYIGLCLNQLGLGTRRYQGFLPIVPRSAPLCIFKGKIVISGHIRSWRVIEEIHNLDCSKANRH